MLVSWIPNCSTERGIVVCLFVDDCSVLELFLPVVVVVVYWDGQRWVQWMLPLHHDFDQPRRGYCALTCYAVAAWMISGFAVAACVALVMFKVLNTSTATLSSMMMTNEGGIGRSYADAVLLMLMRGKRW